MGFVLDMVTGEVSNDDLSKRQDMKADEVTEVGYVPSEYCENLSEVSICPASKVEECFVPEHLLQVDLDQFLDEIENSP